jgi:transglutaminase-like putative cysteine protease
VPNFTGRSQPVVAIGALMGQRGGVLVKVGCSFVQVAEVPTHAVLQVEPRLDVDQTVVEAGWSNEPPGAGATYVDGYGNLCRRLTLSAGTSTLVYDALVEVDEAADAEDLGAAEVDPADLPDEALVYTLPSRYCPSDALADTGWSLFGQVAPGWSRVQAICDWVHDSLTFAYGSSDSLTTAVDVFEARTGVCRDFAHLAVTFCRVFNIPARYAFGYLPPIGVPFPEEGIDFCAWMEVYLSGRWWTFDPRNNERRVGRVLIGRGRDALDVAMVTTYGAVELASMEVRAEEARPADRANGAVP